MQFYQVDEMADKKHERKKILETFTKQDIMDAAIQVLTHHGIQGLTMDRVAREARVAKGTLYVHFKNKEQILKSAVESSFAPLVEELSNLLDSDLSPDKKLEGFTSRYLEYFDTHSDFLRVLLYDRQQAHSQSRRYRTNRYWTLVEKIAEVVDDGIQSSLFQPFDPSRIAVIFIETNVAVAINRLWSKNPEQIEDDAALVSEVLLHGIATSRLQDEIKV